MSVQPSARALLDPPAPVELEAPIVGERPGAILLHQSPVFQGGGGQLADRARIAWSGGEIEVLSAEIGPEGVWLTFAGDARPVGMVRVSVDPTFRRLMCELHTVAHVVNSIVFRAFDGALLTGVQLGPDTAFRMDFDLPGIESDAVRALEAPINEAIRQDHAVRVDYLAREVAAATPGMFRSKAVAPPDQPDGRVRIIEIGDLDRQACGGTHLASTGEARPIRILKVENKGRHNRRVRVGLVG